MTLRRLLALAPLFFAVAAAGANASPPLARFLVVSQVPDTYGQERLAVIDASGHVVRVLSKNANFESVALSPNGRLVAYESTAGLDVEGIHGTDRHVVIPAELACGHHSVCEASDVAWSPDSTELLVSGFQPKPGSYFRYDHISVVSAATGKSYRIVGPRYDTSYRPMAWSGPANKIAYVSEHGAQPYLMLATPTGRSRQTLCSVTCGDPANDPEVAWSPDGNWLVYTTLDDSVEIFDLSTGATTAAHHAGGAGAAWAPDSSRFAAETRAGLSFFSPTGTVVGTTKVVGAFLQGWNAAGIYFITNGRPTTLSVIPTGKTTAEKVFSLPKGQYILWAEPLQ